MSEFKPGKYKTAAGRTLAVMINPNANEHPYMSLSEPNHVGYTNNATLRKADYFGPAVIGDESSESILGTMRHLLAEQEKYAGRLREQLKSAKEELESLNEEVTEAHVVASRRDDENALLARKVKGLEEERDQIKADLRCATDKINDAARDRDRYRKERDKLACKWGEEAHEVARLQTALHEVTMERDRLKRGDFTEEELTGLALRGTYTVWASFLADKAVNYSADADGIEWYRFETVTVAVREGREFLAVKSIDNIDFWFVRDVNGFTSSDVSRDQAEAWCREQLLPQWRAATVEDVAGKPKCRVRMNGQADWSYKLLLAHDERLVGGPWATVSESGNFGRWPICEVLK